jgi:hypothetical protein
MATITLTFVLVAVTIVYAWSTYRIQKANESIVALTKQQLENALRPYISVGVFVIPNSLVFKLCIVNTGRTAAKNLSLSLDRSFCQFADPKRDLLSLRAFKESVDSFPPGAELSFLLATSIILFGPSAAASLTPPTFSITASYDFGAGRVVETTAIDLRPYLDSGMPIDPLISELHECRTVLEGIRQEMRDANGARG